MKNYDDIINTSWPLPSDKGRMSLKDRAKIFLPFAALKGYDEALEQVRENVNKQYDESVIPDIYIDLEAD